MGSSPPVFRVRHINHDAVYVSLYLCVRRSAISRRPASSRSVTLGGIPLFASGMSGASRDARLHIPSVSCPQLLRLTLNANRTLSTILSEAIALLFNPALSSVAGAAPSPKTGNISEAWFHAWPWMERQGQINVPLRRRGLLLETLLLRHEAGVKTGRPQATGGRCSSLGNGHERTMSSRFMRSHMSWRQPEGLFVC